MSGTSHVGVLMKDAYIHLCAALDHLEINNKREGILVYQDHEGEIIISGTASKLCEAMFASLKEIGREGVFKSPRSMYNWLSCYHTKDYVNDSYVTGKGWFIERHIVTGKNTRYLIRHKAKGRQ